jgi:HTH-type transcriptional regulator, sugar sensing transcriptional regulator
MLPFRMEALEKLGMTKNEVKIYLALLELGSSTTGPIIKNTGIHTSKVYDGLERLADKGLVSHVVEAGVRHFKAVSPDRLLDYLENKKVDISHQEEEIKQILPALKLKQQLAGDDTEAEIFRGWKGMETVYRMLRDGLQKGELNYIFGASKGEDEERVRSFFNRHVNLIMDKGIKQKIIFNESARGNISAYDNNPLFTVKYLKNTTPAEINIWADKTMIVLLTMKPVVILISNDKVADSFRNFFDVMWTIAS